jgi:hypothetical protein
MLALMKSFCALLLIAAILLGFVIIATGCAQAAESVDTCLVSLRSVTTGVALHRWYRQGVTALECLQDAKANEADYPGTIAAVRWRKAPKCRDDQELQEFGRPDGVRYLMCVG